MARGDPPQTQPDPVSVFLEGTKLVPISLLQSMSVSRGRVCGDIFPRVPEEASLTSGGELFLGIPNLGAPYSLCLPLGVSGDMVSHRGATGTRLLSLPRLSGEPVCLPGFLGVPKTSQSWAGSLSRQEQSLKLPGREVSDLHLSDGSVCPAALGMRLSISELSFLLGALGYHSLQSAAPWSHFFPGWGLPPVLGGLVLTTRKSLRGVSPCETSLGGGASRRRGFQGGYVCPWGGETVSPRVI